MARISNSLTLNGKASVGDGSLLDFSDNSTAQSLSGTGTVTFTGANTYGTLAIEDGVNVTIGSGLTIDGIFGIIGAHNFTTDSLGNSLTNDGIIASDGGGAFFLEPDAFTNNGTLKAANSSSLNVNVPFTNTGAVQVDANSTLSVNGDLTQTGGTTLVNGALKLKNGAGTLALQAGTLSGVGTITGNVTNSGTVHPGSSLGTLAIQGNYTQNADGILDIDLGGMNAGVNTSLLSVLDNATLAGNVDVKLVNGFTPTNGETFDFLTYGNRTGSFDQILSLDTGFTYNVSYNDTAGIGTLIVTATTGVPEASTLFSTTLMLVTGGLLLRRRQQSKEAPTA